ncbi:unnamed protein product [Ambrosiozyma monospora]|uniref:Unnamed protein product n=1 Tax=Ambrosiozyma monospora TaxID=43982 RepID=A0A9W7DIC8_AMBMO|nr:unnamed protein product [Ambrosiozyma monospora]
MSLKGWDSYYLDYAKTNDLTVDPTKDLNFVHPHDYYALVFSVFKNEYVGSDNKEMSIELLKGFSFSGGSSQASDATINIAIKSFLTFWRTITPQEQNFILGNLMDILKPLDAKLAKLKTPKVERLNKLHNSCLKFWCNILELNVPLPDDFKMRNLFIRVYNLSLGTSNIPRLLTCIRIFIMIYLSSPADFADCEKRLKFLKAKHPIPKVKNAAADALKEIEYERSHPIEN